MKQSKLLTRVISIFMAVLMLLSVTPLSSILQLDIPVITASAASKTSGKIGKNIKWSYDANLKKLTISGKGDMPEFGLFENPPWYSLRKKVTSLEVKDSVTSVSASAFCDFSKLQDIKLASSVKEIGSMAFDETKWLKNQPNGLVYINSILYAVKGELNPLKPVTIKADTTSITPLALAFQTGIRSITIPKKIKIIPDGAFMACENLKSVKIEGNVTKISDAAFSMCASLKSINLPKSLKTIGMSAFMMCSKLSSVSLPEGLKTIGDGAFSGTAIKNVTLPKSLKKLGDAAFVDSPVTAYKVKAKNQYFSADKNGVLYNKNKTKLLAFPCASDLTSYSTAKSTKEIASMAFSSSKLKSITFSSNLKTIRSFAFSDCTKLEKISKADNLSYSEDGLTDTKWFKNQPKGPVYLGKVLLSYKGTIPEDTSVSVKKGTVMIASSAFDGQDELYEVILPKGLKTIGSSAFSGCTALEKINIPSTVTAIEDFAFTLCESLEKITIPSSVKTIGTGAFFFAESLESIRIENPFCEIGAISLDFSTEDFSQEDLFEISATAIPQSTKIYGYKGSTAQDYAKKSGNKFSALKPIDISTCKTSSIKNQKYTGKSITPAVTVKYAGSTLVAGKHFKVEYSSNKKAGTATATITGNPKYGFTGTQTVKFKIVKK